MNKEEYREKCGEIIDRLFDIYNDTNKFLCDNYKALKESRLSVVNIEGYIRIRIVTPKHLSNEFTVKTSITLMSDLLNEIITLDSSTNKEYLVSKILSKEELSSFPFNKWLDLLLNNYNLVHKYVYSYLGKNLIDYNFVAKDETTYRNLFDYINNVLYRLEKMYPNDYYRGDVIVRLPELTIWGDGSLEYFSVKLYKPITTKYSSLDNIDISKMVETMSLRSLESLNMLLKECPLILAEYENNIKPKEMEIEL